MRSAGATAMKLCVRWGFEPIALITMADEHDLRRWYLDAPAWGQVAFQEGGYVMSHKDMRRRFRKQAWKKRCLMKVKEG